MKVLRLTDENWSEHVLSAPGTVLVDFWASWCPPCRLLAPEIETLAGSAPGHVAVGKLDVDATPQRPGGTACARSRPSPSFERGPRNRSAPGFRERPGVEAVAGAVPGARRSWRPLS